MRTSRHRSAASRAGRSPFPRSATYRGVGQQPSPTPRRAVAPNPAHIRGSSNGRTPHFDCGNAGSSPALRTIPHPARSRGLCSAGKLRTSLPGLLPPLARTFMAAVMASGLLFGEAQAQHCGLRADAVKVLREQFGESVVIEKVSPDGKAILETWRNLETGTWTLLSTQIIRERRVSCIVASGGGWVGDAPEKGEEL